LVQSPEPEFTSRYADPNHPASEGSPIALLTGGRLTEKQIFKYTAAGLAYNQGRKAYAKHKERKASQGDLADGINPEAEPSPTGDGEAKSKEGVSEGLNKMASKLKKVSSFCSYLRDEWVLIGDVESGIFDDCEYAH